MKHIMKKLIVLALSISLVLNVGGTVTAATRTLSETQKETADTIAKIAIDNWNTYGVLPSIAVTQAFIESTLGDHCRGYNLWGIASGAVSYGSLYEGTIGYLKVINNGCYKGAPFQKDYRVQLRKILDGGYCQPEGQYYSNAMWSVDAYDFDQYDQKLFEKIKKEKEAAKKARLEKKRLKKQKKTFTVVYDPEVPINAAVVDTSIIKKGTVNIWYQKELRGIYDVKSGGKGYEVRVNNPSLDGLKVKLDVHEEAKG